jgi:hypothetical protein
LKDLLAVRIMASTPSRKTTHLEIEVVVLDSIALALCA